MMLRRFISTARTFPINVTDNAWHKMQNIIHSQNSFCFFFSADNGGCHGFNYNLNLMDKEKYSKFTKNLTTPSLLESQDYDVRILVDPYSEMILFGTTIDFVNEDFSKGVFENKFIFKPDNELVNACGCGVSFSLK